MKKIFSKEVIIGACVIAALAILFFGIDFLKGVNIFKAANYYYASYTNVEGLAVSAPVTVNGYKVGLVRSIEYEYDNPGHVLVELSLDRHLHVPQGSKAILTSDLLGTASIKLELAKADSNHEIGDRLIGENESGMMDAISQQLMPGVSEILPKVDSLLSNINAIAGDPALLAAVKRLDAITANLEATSRNISALSAQFTPVMNNLKAVAANANTITGDLTQVSGKLKQAPVDSLMADLQVTVNNLKDLSVQLNDPNSTLGKITHDPALYNNLNSTVQSLDSLFTDIKANPKRYINIKVF